MKAVILAGGYGTRLSEETDRIPKPMVEIGGRPILWHIMKIYGHYGVRDFIICTGYKGYAIKEYFHNYFLHMSDVTLDIKNQRMEVHRSVADDWRVTLVDTGLNTMTGGRLKRVARYIGDEPFHFTYGDGVADIDIHRLWQFHRSHGRLATVTAVTPPGRFGTLRVEGRRVVGFQEKVASADSLINGGFFVLESAVLTRIHGDEEIWEREPMEALASENQLVAYRHEGFWQPMDTLRERRSLEESWSRGQAPWKVWDSADPEQ